MNYIIKKKSFHRRFKKKLADYFYDKFIFYWKLVFSTTKSDRLKSLKSIDKNLKSQRQQFWKYVSNFKKHRSGSIRLEVVGAHLVQPSAVADNFPKHF
jgi:hypothetical protein